MEHQMLGLVRTSNLRAMAGKEWGREFFTACTTEVNEQERGVGRLGR